MLCFPSVDLHLKGNNFTIVTKEVREKGGSEPEDWGWGWEIRGGKIKKQGREREEGWIGAKRGKRFLDSL